LVKLKKMNYRSVLILGLGRSGKEVGLLLKEKGKNVTIAETKNIPLIFRKKRQLEKLGIKVSIGPFHQNLLKGKDLVIISPGIDPALPLVKKTKLLGIPVLSELEIASRFLPREKIIAVTGTNGKTTTCFLTYKILRENGIKVKLAGNIGVPLSRLARVCHPASFDFVITEISSFQLETTGTFSPHVYAILNISPDHLDRHLSFDEYRKVKCLPLLRMKRDDIAFLNYDESWVKSVRGLTKARVIFFSKTQKLEKGLYREKGQIIARLEEGNFQISLDGLRLQNFHNWENVLCAVGIAILQKIDIKSIHQVLRSYQPLPHRQEIVGEVKGVKFINDSKATNPGSVENLLESVEKPVILIMGGKDKGGDFSFLLKNKNLNKIKSVLTIGETGRKIKLTLARFVRVVECGSLEEAVKAAFSLSQEGDTVVLCPGCSSFDQFRSYRQRGAIFKREVKKLLSYVTEKKLL